MKHWVIQTFEHEMHGCYHLKGEDFKSALAAAIKDEWCFEWVEESGHDVEWLYKWLKDGDGGEFVTIIESDSPMCTIKLA